MNQKSSPLPCAVSVPADTGIIARATAHYEKRLSDLRGLFLDAADLERRIREENDPLCYENYAFNQNQADGDIFFGTTIIYPGRVGSEYHLTRGHYHSKRNHAETYQALCPAKDLCCLNEKTEPPAARNLRRARLPISRPIGRIDR
jgi:oxalate decarboxylase/phosphoglucose isomerase-like protein (cupin superfamily)